MKADHKSQRLIDEMNRYYDARAPWHDDYMGYRSHAAMEELLAPIIAACDDLIRGKNVLEIACGTGNWTQVLAKRAHAVVAVDISPASLAIARTKLLAYSNVSLIPADAYDLGDVGGPFDVLLAADWWSHIPKGAIPSFLKTIQGQLLPDSKGVLIDMAFQEHFAVDPWYYDDDNNRVSLRRLPDGSEYHVVKNFPDESELKTALAGYAKNIIFHEFDALKRWMVVFDV
jgi:ubiquinone/menaquinone biosynthesis C-methylase UbiE